MGEILLILVAVVTGTIIASILSCLPALHIYNVAGIIIVLIFSIKGLLASIPDSVVLAFMMSLVVGYSFLNTIPSIFLGTPDESAIWITLPGQKYLMHGKGYEGAMLTGVGGLFGIAFLVLLSPFAHRIFPIMRNLLTPHMFWILATVLGFIVMSDWPKGGDFGRTRWHKLWDGWKSLIAGLSTLILSGIFGFIILYRPVVPIEFAFQNIMPAFVGLFAIPWIIQNIISKEEIPEQHISRSLDINATLFIRGGGAGALGGIFAAFFPIVTGGIGGLLAGHATAQRDDRLFIISQGASKVVYYVGAFMLLFVPGLYLTRGGMAWMIQGFLRPKTMGDFYGIMGAISLSGVLSFLLLSLFSKGVIWVIKRVNYRLLSVFTLIFVSIVVYGITSWQGLFIMVVGGGIGLIPVLFHSRRMNCLGVLLIPITLNMAGVGPQVAKFMGLFK